MEILFVGRRDWVGNWWNVTPKPGHLCPFGEIRYTYISILLFNVERSWDQERTRYIILAEFYVTWHPRKVVPYQVIQIFWILGVFQLGLSWRSWDMVLPRMQGSWPISQVGSWSGGVGSSHSANMRRYPYWSHKIIWSAHTVMSDMKQCLQLRFLARIHLKRIQKITIICQPSVVRGATLKVQLQMTMFN